MSVPPGSEPGRVESLPAGVGVLACISDVHGNTAALEAVLASAEFAEADAVAFLGCLTPGPDPRGALERCRELSIPTFHLAGNGERALLEMSRGQRDFARGIDEWLLTALGSDGLATVGAWPSGLTCELVGGRRIRMCHGSPRSDVELLTPMTPDRRVHAATAGVSEDTIAHGHTHLQYQREIAGRRLVGPGSVGIPHTDGPFGAPWALISDDVRLIVTPYDIGAAERLIERCGYPSPVFLQQLRSPIAPSVICEDAEQRRFAD